MNIFDFALQMEADGKAYYEKLAVETTIPEFRNIFALLAESEQGHHDAIQAIRDGIPPDRADVKALDHAKNVFTKLQEMQQTHESLQFDRDGYLHAIHAEEESIRFYEDAARKENNEEARKLLLELADEEREHLSIVENIYDFVEKPRTFLAWGEFSNREDL